MEGSPEVNESVDNSAETPYVKRKENDHLNSQTDNCLSLQNPAPVVIEDIGWTEHLSSLKSPEMLLETLAGKGPYHDFGAHSVSEPLITTCPSDLSGAIMKDITLHNFKFSDGNISGCSGIVEDSPIRKGLWQNLTRITGVYGINSAPGEFSRVGDSGKSVRSSMPHSLEKKDPQLPQFSLNYLKTSHNVVESDKQGFSRINIARHSYGIRKRVSHASGFRQFLAKSTLKGKGVAYCHQGTDSDHAIVSPSQNIVGIDGDKVKNFALLHKPIAKDVTLLLGGGVCPDSNVPQGSSSLRDWLKQKHNFSNRFERLQMFKQILELVDVLHSQGLALHHLKPSYLVLSPSGLVEYIGSVNSLVQTGNQTCSRDEDVTQESHLKRKRSIDYDIEFPASLQLKECCDQEVEGSLNHQILGETNQTVVQHHHIYPQRADLQGSSSEENYYGNIGTRTLDVRSNEKNQFVGSCRSSSILGSQNLCSHNFQGSVSGFLNLEDIWYACPEKLNESACPLSSNIYSVGVLFFELFCSFEMEEMHFAAMANLRHRILPPNFLSEYPKEAGFCLWLLHPDPSSRPKSREILSSNLIVGCNKILAKNQPSATIDEEDAEADLLLHFLSSLKDQRENQAAMLLADIQCLETDIEEVERRYLSRVGSPTNARDLLDSSNGNSNMCPRKVLSWSVSSANEERLLKNIDQLRHAYFSMRSSFELSGTNSATRTDVGVLRIHDNLRREADIKEESSDHLGAFFEGLCKYARYNRFEVCGSLRNADILNSANVICSLSFDRDEDYFAAAGVSKKIKIFEFEALLSDTVDVHYPLLEMSSRSKLSCVSWNSYIKNYIASTDYEGVVQLWDVTTGQGFAQYAEHEKRAWSVDFSLVDPTKLASGSDDCSVKLWSIKEKVCIDTIRNVANVCCVQFSPYSSHLLTFGSADYKIYCYDLRNSRSPWCTLSGHGKAVSYVKFVDCETLVSASTDNTLKLWDLKKSSTSGLSTNSCDLTFTGHTNEKNFVGLTAFDGYIACGSETNEVFSYYKALPMPITSHNFGSIDPITGQETIDDNGQFVSSVCWRTKSNMVVAANSSGSLKLLQLI